ncbi:MAG: hypothetical protein HY073_05745 [Deltaproteobacteria bacterium]|nr:hypothetical protein [Deltaproteobacteria bacterium]
MQKTTIYLGERELQGLKTMALQTQGRSCATLIREAVQEYLRKKKGKPIFKFLRSQLHQKAHKSSFGESVSYQRNLRSEWR